MKILIVGSHSAEPNEVIQMSEYAQLFGASFCCTDELVFTVNTSSFEVFDGRNNCAVDSYDLAVFRGKLRTYSRTAYCLSKYLQLKQIKSLNDHLLHRSLSKLAQAIDMHELGLPFPKTVASDNPRLLLEHTVVQFSFPFILKDTNGAHGKLNFLVNNKTELEDLLQANPDTAFVAQEYIPNNGDYRILIAGDDSLVIKRQSADGSHLNNTSQGGTASLVPSDEFPTRIIEQAHQLARKLRRDIAGVDVIQDSTTGELVFLEINSQPQLVTGAFTSEKRKLIQRYLATLSDSVV